MLRGVRRRIRCYVWVRGLAVALALAGACFWLSLAVDWFFEPAVSIRRMLLASAALALALALYRAIGRRALVPLPDASMALLIERRFPHFGDSLVTAVELTARPPDENDCHPALLEATCRAAAEPIGQVRPGEVLDGRPLRRAIAAAAALWLATVVFAALAPAAFAIWQRRCLLLSEQLWPRKTALSVEGFADGVAKVARGADFTLIAKADMLAEHVPPSVRVFYRPEGAGRLQTTMIREGRAIAGRDRYQQYTHTFRGVIQPIGIEINGGDAWIDQLRIEVVDTPILVRLEIECRYPAYMARPPQVFPAAGTVPIPQGAEVTLLAESNKPLVRAQMDGGDGIQTVADARLKELVEIAAAQRELAASAKNGDGLPPRQAEFAERLARCAEQFRRLAAAAGNPGTFYPQALDELARIEAEMRRLGEGQERPSSARLRTLADRLEKASDAIGRLVSFTRFRYRLQALSEDRRLAIGLLDVDGIRSPEPIRLNFSVVGDAPPQVAVQLQGIGSAITPQARLPFRGRITDDYGVDRVWLEYVVEGRAAQQETLLKVEAAVTEQPVDGALDVRPLGLEPGQKMLITVKAGDRCDLGEGPNSGTGDRWMLDVVSPAQLRAMLEAREIVLRQRLETIIEDVAEIRDTLARLLFDAAGEPAAALGAEPGEAKTGNSPERQQTVRLLRIQRARGNGQKDAHETLGVAEAFADIRHELVNNRIYTEELRIRIEQDIVAPLEDLGNTQFVELDKRLALLEKAANNSEEAPTLRDGALEQVDLILRSMRGVLSRMAELEDFNEAVELLRSIIGEQDDLRRQTLERRKDKLRQLLEN